MQQGQVVADEFMLQRLLDGESDGNVWRGLELSVGRLVLIRFLPREFIPGPEAVDRLRRRLEQIRPFRHPHGVPTDRFVEASESGPFLVSRYVDGPLLDDYAAQWIRAEGAFPFQLVFDVLRPVAALLDAAGKAGFVHRTLSPRRIVVSQTEGVQVFGLELDGVAGEIAASTAAGHAVESVFQRRYQAPEQLAGGSASPFSDQYSLAAIVWELLAGRPPASPVPLIPGYPDQVGQTVQRAMHETPANRFPCCTDFLDTLAASNSVSPSSAVAELVAAGPDSPSATSWPDSGESFERIASHARKANADHIAVKINRERRMKRFFRAWNVLILVGCCIAAFVFRDQLGFGPKRESEKIPVAVSPELPPATTETVRPVHTKTTRILRVRRSKTPKEEDFSSPSRSSFQSLDGAETPDAVRFLGTSGSGGKIVFVVDASAPMGNGAQTPWDLVQKELAHSFRDLNASQRFQVVYYSDVPRLLPGGQGAKPWIPASPQSLKASHDFLKGVETAGRGNPFQALEKAISLQPDVVFFLSDRKSTALTSKEIGVLKRTLGDVSFHAVEIGDGLESDPKSPIAELARQCRGEYRWINAELHRLQR